MPPLKFRVVKTDKPLPSGKSPLVLCVPVRGQRGTIKDLEMLDASASEAEVHERVGGYWLHSGRLSRVQEALKQGRRVFVLGYAEKCVVRVLEVTPGRSAYPHPENFVGTKGEKFSLVDSHSELTWVPVSGASKPFATVYHALFNGRNVRRVRYHTEGGEDEGLIGREIDHGEGDIWRSGFWGTFANLEDAPPPLEQ
jgi:hypothetical protein